VHNAPAQLEVVRARIVHQKKGLLEAFRGVSRLNKDIISDRDYVFGVLLRIYSCILDGASVFLLLSLDYQTTLRRAVQGVCLFESHRKPTRTLSYSQFIASYS
jgi:hypothetical protein